MANEIVCRILERLIVILKREWSDEVCDSYYTNKTICYYYNHHFVTLNYHCKGVLILFDYQVSPNLFKSISKVILNCSSPKSQFVSALYKHSKDEGETCHLNQIVYTEVNILITTY